MNEQIIIKDFSITKSNAFTEINPLGIYIYNSPKSYIKFGSGQAIIKAEDLQVNNISILGNLYVYGTQVIGDTASDLSGTTLPNFTIGSTVTTDPTKLIFGNYTSSNYLQANGNIITSSKPIEAPSFTKNGNEIGAYTVKQCLISTNLLQDSNLDLPDGKTYIRGEDKLFVFVDGRLQVPNIDFAESPGTIGTSATQVSFLYDIAPEARITFIIIGW